MTENENTAIIVAKNAHYGQMYGDKPYSYHIDCVHKIATELGFDETVRVSALLHDTLGDTIVSYAYLKENFGCAVAEIVYAVTDELGRNRKERKEKTYPKIRENWRAVVVKICDRISNIENCIDKNPSLLEMYKKEHEDFCRNLMSSEHNHVETNRAWKRLNELMDSITK